MVRFEKDKIVIEIEAQFPKSEWLEHVRDLVWADGAIDKDMVDSKNDGIYGLCQLVLEMLPEVGDAPLRPGGPGGQRHDGVNADMRANYHG